MAVIEPTKPAPIAGAARIAELDVLRGFALLGVFLGVVSELIFYNFSATPGQLAALPSVETDQQTGFVIKLLVTNKANTLFAFLFGLGFYLQLDRLKSRSENYLTIYRRRLGILLIFGVINMFYIFPMDILHLYGLVGFFLIELRLLKDKTLLVLGVTLALFSFPMVELLINLTGFQELFDGSEWFGKKAIYARQALVANWHYSDIYSHFATFNLQFWLLSSEFIGFMFYVLGRFLLGMWVGRRGWLIYPHLYLSGFRRGMWICLPAGLLLEYAFLTLPSGIKETPLGTLLHMIGVPTLATGYLCLVVVGLNSPVFGRTWALLAPVGKMALTNYVLGGVFAFLVLFGPSGLAGHAGLADVAGYSFLFFVLQILFSNIWLKWYKFGPLEWAWRALTYGTRPAFRKVRPKLDAGS